MVKVPPDHAGQSPGPPPSPEVLGVPSLGPLASEDAARPAGGRSWARFDGAELAIVCSHYDLGVIKGAKLYRRGSSRAPKVVLKTSKGLFLLKRRAPGRDNPYRVAFCHAVQLHLARHNYPTPRLVGTRDENNSMLQLHGRVYEMFEFVRGQPYDSGEPATSESGRALGWFHRLMAPFASRWTPPRGTYHRAPGVDAHMATLGDNPALKPVASRLDALLGQAAERADAAGAPDWPEQIVHGDWHPGNLIFRDGKAVAVLDFDSARMAPRAMDLANGALQFSVVMPGSDPAAWPREPDVQRIRRFVGRYDAVDECRLSESEVLALPWLMIEALVVESVVPVARHGHFGGLNGAAFLEAAHRKASWLAGNAERLAAMLG